MFILGLILLLIGLFASVEPNMKRNLLVVGIILMAVSLVLWWTPLTGPYNWPLYRDRLP
jgi:multisubunit Na+/H+ antiporter MnhC subunit